MIQNQISTYFGKDFDVGSLGRIRGPTFGDDRCKPYERPKRRDPYDPYEKILTKDLNEEILTILTKYLNETQT